MTEVAEPIIKDDHIQQGKATLKKVTPEEVAQKLAKRNATAPVEKVDPPVEKNELPANKIVEKIENKEKVEGEKVEAKEGEKVEEQKPQKLRDKVKPFTKNKPADLKAEGEVVIPEPIKVKMTAYEKEIAEKNGILSDPEVKAFLEMRKAGKSAIDIVKEVISGQVDTSKMTDAQVYEHGLKANGVKPASELDKDSEESSLEDEMDKFRNMGKLAQKREADSIRKEIEASNTGTTETLLSKLVSHNEKAQAAQNAAKQEELKKLGGLENGIKEWADAYVGQEHYTVVGTPQLAESIKNFDLTQLIFPTKEDGSLDVEKVADLIHYSLTKDLRLENLENQNFYKGFDELKKEVEVTKGASVGILRTPAASKPKSETEAVQEVHSKMKPVSAGHQSVRR